MYVWDGDGDKRRKIKCVPILLSRVERERRRAKNLWWEGAREDGEVEGRSVARATTPSLPLPETLEQRRVKKIYYFSCPKEKRGMRFSDEARKKTTQIVLYELRVLSVGRLTISRYRVLPARAGITLDSCVF